MYVFLVIFLCVSYLVHHAWDNFDSIVHLRPLVLAAHLPFKIFSSFQLTDGLVALFHGFFFPLSFMSGPPRFVPIEIELFLSSFILYKFLKKKKKFISYFRLKFIIVSDLNELINFFRHPLISRFWS